MLLCFTLGGSTEPSLDPPQPTTLYSRFYEEDKVLIAEIQIILTLILIQTKINSKEETELKKENYFYFAKHKGFSI